MNLSSNRDVTTAVFQIDGRTIWKVRDEEYGKSLRPLSVYMAGCSPPAASITFGFLIFFFLLVLFEF